MVFDIGGHRGDFASNVYAKYGCEIHVLEPLSDLYNIIQSRFAYAPTVHTYPFGISDFSQEVEMMVDDNASSVYKTGGKRAIVQLMEMEYVMNQLSVRDIDLVKINIEGGEFPLLAHCVKNQLVSKMKNIQVQFHIFVDDATSKREALQRQLSDTHELTYDYPFVWENWKLKTSIKANE